MSTINFFFIYLRYLRILIASHVSLKLGVAYGLRGLLLLPLGRRRYDVFSIAEWFSLAINARPQSGLLLDRVAARTPRLESLSWYFLTALHHGLQL